MITRESSWNPTAKNSGSTAYGLGQFLDTTWDDVGGAFTSDPAQQLDYVFRYLKQRYNGSPLEALNFHDQNNWYDVGGWLPKGVSLAINNTGDREPVLTHDQGKAVQAMAKQVTKPQPTPRPQVPDAQTKIPQQQPRVPMKQLPAPIAQEPPTGPPPPVAQQPPQPAQSGPAIGPGAAGGQPPLGIVAPPSGLDHTLPWINQGIASTASVAGNLAATAASMGAGAAGAGPLGGIAASMIAGGAQQIGKVATNVANVVSSALVGSVPGLFTDTPSGQVMRAEQNRPSTATVRGGDT
ncbi:lytic transglycosylase domain-containing protein [Mycolicibacterium hippocampi]|uniref:lytic transglycosylase domain-containing protein n=1 Tax=Mycolicibacterium hippocampi TaxID=659824 RepID=UPI0021F3192A|nr:lytic transglycosylase domain-containing protein [Mycolicibacterium hippocampi]